MSAGLEARVREVPELRVVVVSDVLDQAGLEAWLPGAMARAFERAAGGALTTDDLPYLERTGSDPVIFTTYEGNPNLGPCEIIVAVAVRTEGDRTIPAHREAFVRVTKELVTGGGLGDAYDAAESAAGADAGPPTETYWTDFGDASPGDEVFDVGWRIG
jgi:hypothetical protein